MKPDESKVARDEEGYSSRSPLTSDRKPSPKHLATAAEALKNAGSVISFWETME